MRAALLDFGIGFRFPQEPNGCKMDLCRVGAAGGRRKLNGQSRRGTHTTRGAPQKIRETISPSQRPPQLPETELIFVLKKSFFGVGFHVSWIRNAAACSRGTKEKTTRKRTAASARQVRRVAVGG
jgi:hypothetical protein